MSGVWIKLHDTHVRCDRQASEFDAIDVARAITRLYNVTNFLPECEQDNDYPSECECHPITSEARRICRAFDYHEQRDNWELGIVK